MPNHRTGWMLLLFAMLTAGGVSVACATDKPATVYTGTIGKQSVVFELGGGAHEYSGFRYFYTRHHRDLELDGKLEADHVALREGSDGGDSRPLITLDRQTDGGWRGSWQGANGKSLSIVLHPAKPAPPAVDAVSYLKQLYANDTYEYLRLTSLKPQPGKQEQFMGYTLQWWSVSDAGITFFEVMDGYPDAERRRINRVLMNRLWQETSAYYACVNIPANGGDFEQTVTPRLLTPHLVSVSVFTSYYCGGAHPDFGDAPINLDARTAKSLTLEDILWVGEGKPPHYVEASYAPGTAADSTTFDAYSRYRDSEFPSWLIRQWNDLYPNEMQAPQSDDDCDYDVPGAWQFVSWYMTPTGIFVIPSLDGAVRSCRLNDDWSVLPWSIVRKHPGRLGLTPAS